MRFFLRILAYLGVGVLGAITIHNMATGLNVNVNVSVAATIGVWALYGTAFYRELFGLPGKGYTMNNLFGFLVVNDGFQKTVTVEHGGNQVALRIAGNALAMKPIFPEEGEEELIQLVDYNPFEVDLPIGKFVVHRVYSGYKIWWTDGKKWKLAKK